MYTEYYYDNSLYHSGIKGMKWGNRRYQNEDGSLTPAGKERYGHITKNGKYVASNGVVIGKSRNLPVKIIRKYNTYSLTGRFISAIGRKPMSKLTGRSVESIKERERKEREALKEYYKLGGDKMLEKYQKQNNILDKK